MDRERRCLCVWPPAVSQGCLCRYFKLALKTNTQMAAFYYQSSSQRRGTCGWQLSVIPYTVKQHVAHSEATQKHPYSFSSLHASLVTEITISKALCLIFIIFLIDFLSPSFLCVDICVFLSSLASRFLSSPEKRKPV